MINASFDSMNLTKSYQQLHKINVWIWVDSRGISASAVQLGPVILTPVEFYAKIDNSNVATNVIKTLLSNYLELRNVIAYIMK